MDTPPTSQAKSGVSVKGTALVAVGMVAAQIISLAQMLVFSRILGPVEFGVFGSLGVVMLLGSTAMVATQVVLARHYAMANSAHIGMRPVWAVGIGTALVATLVTPLMAWLLNMPDWWGLAFIAATFIPLTISGAQLGRLQGQELYTRIGVLYLITTAARVAGGISGAVIGRSADAAALGILVGAALAAVLGALMIPKEPDSTARPQEGARALVFEIGHAGHALVALYALTNIDMLLARSQLSSHNAGLYAAGQLVARAVFFLPQAILVAAFPRMVSQPGNRAQRQTTAAVGALGIGATLGTALLPGLVLAVIAGPAYAEVTDSLWIFALAGAGFGVVQVLLYARLAQHDRRAAILMWSGVIILIALGVTIGQRSVTSMATCAASVAWLVAIIGLILQARSPAAPRNLETTGEPI